MIRKCNVYMQTDTNDSIKELHANTSNLEMLHRFSYERKRKLRENIIKINSRRAYIVHITKIDGFNKKIIFEKVQL